MRWFLRKGTQDNPLVKVTSLVSIEVLHGSEYHRSADTHAKSRNKVVPSSNNFLSNRPS
jgi:hypothetical protein